jgi:hypothetical protein
MSQAHSFAPPAISRGIVPGAARVGIYGPEGIGKSTLAAKFPDPIFADVEGGTAHLDVARFPRPQTWPDVLAAVQWLLVGQHEFKTFVLDSVDSLERLIAAEICRRSNKEGLEDFGYGKGFTYLAEEFARFLAQLDKLRERGLHVVLIGHSTIRKFEAPDAAGSYDRYELKLAKQVAALAKEWVDALLFVNYVTKFTEKDGKQKAVGGRERVIHTTHAAAFDAKNRFGLEEKLPCSITALAPVFSRSTNGPISIPVAPPPPAAATRPGPVLLITREQIEKLELYWRATKKTEADKAKAFAWVGCDSIDFAWDELTADQAQHLIVKLQEQMNRAAEASSSTAARAGRGGNGGAK